MNSAIATSSASTTSSIAVNGGGDVTASAEQLQALRRVLYAVLSDEEERRLTLGVLVDCNYIFFTDFFFFGSCSHF
jgi:hypothetical protein